MSQPTSSSRHHYLSPPPDLPSSSKLLLPSLPFPVAPEEEEPAPPSKPTACETATCDHAPLWECVVNGIGGCEALEAQLRECEARASAQPLPEPEVASRQCDYAPLWECIVNGNGGCEVLEDELRACLQTTRN